MTRWTAETVGMVSNEIRTSSEVWVPVFLLPWIVGGAVAVVAAIVGKSIYDSVHEKGGLVVSIVGPRSVGKTSLARFIAEGIELPIEYVPTKASKPYKVDFDLDVDGKPWVLHLNDLGGHPDQVAQWSKSDAAKASDVIWFLASAKHLADDDARGRTETMARTLMGRGLPAQLILVVSHSDADAEFDGARIETLSVHGDVQKLSRILGSRATVVGSLQSSADARALADELTKLTSS